MPARTVSLSNPTVGDLVLPSNSYRALLRYRPESTQFDMIVVGDSFESGIPLVTQFNNDQILRFNEAGTAMRAAVYVLQNNSSGITVTTEIYRTVAGIT